MGEHRSRIEPSHSIGSARRSEVAVVVLRVAVLGLVALASAIGTGVAGADTRKTIVPRAPGTLSSPRITRPAVVGSLVRSAAALSGQITGLTVTPQTVTAGTEVVIMIQFSGGSGAEQFGVVITDLNDDFDPFSCSETLVSGTPTAGTEQQVCSVPATAYIGGYSAQGVIFSPGPPPTTEFSGPDVSFAVVDSQAITITTSSLPDGVVWSRATRSTYTAGLSATGGNPPYKWSLAIGSGPLPPGLRLHRSSGAITGKARRAGTFVFVVQVVDTKTRPKPRTQNSAARVMSITAR